MRNDTRQTRERILDAAEELFAVAGTGPVSLRDVTRAAGQANNSAIHYHFGSREALIDQVLARHARDIDAERAVLLTQVSEPATVAQLLAVILVPLADRLRSRSGRNFLRILLSERYRGGIERPGSDEFVVSPSLARVYQGLDGLLDFPLAVRRARISCWSDMMIAALAGRAEQQERGLEQWLSADEFTQNLIDMGCAGLTATPHPMVARAAPSDRSGEPPVGEMLDELEQ